MIKNFLFAVVLFAATPALALASVNLTALDVSPDPAEPGQSVDLTIEVERIGSGCSNNWYGTRLTIDGEVQPDIIYPVDTYAIGQGTSTATHAITATSTEGTSQILVEILSGPETNPNNCAIGVVDSDTIDLEVKKPAPVSSGPKSSGSISGGGGFIYCDLWAGQPVGEVHQCLDRNTGRPVKTLEWRAGTAGSSAYYANLEAIKQQLLRILGILESLSY